MSENFESIAEARLLTHKHGEFERTIDIEISRSARYQRELTLTAINPAFHKGKSALWPSQRRIFTNEFIKILSDRLRSSDFFTSVDASLAYVCMPETGGEDAARVIERLLADQRTKRLLARLSAIKSLTTHHVTLCPPSSSTEPPTLKARDVLTRLRRDALGR